MTMHGNEGEGSAMKKAWALAGLLALGMALTGCEETDTGGGTSNDIVWRFVNRSSVTIEVTISRPPNLQPISLPAGTWAERRTERVSGVNIQLMYSWRIAGTNSRGDLVTATRSEPGVTIITFQPRSGPISAEDALN
jgi:hypothetical protein